MDTPLSRAHNMIRSVINSGGTVSKYWMEDAMELLAKDGGLTPLALDGGESAASEQFPTPEVLSTLQGESTPAHRK